MPPSNERHTLHGEETTMLLTTYEVEEMKSYVDKTSKFLEANELVVVDEE